MKNNHIIRHIVYAIIISVVLLFISNLTGCIDKAITNYVNLQGTLLGVWATIIGFILTALSILLTIKETPFIKALKRTEHYKSLLKVFLDVCYFSAACFIMSFLGALIAFSRFYYYVEFFMIVLNLIRLASCFYILKIIIEDVGEEPEED